MTKEDLNKRDRALSAFVYALASLGRWDVIFKGGTMLRLAVFEEYRYSEDIDVTYIGTQEHETHRLLQDICYEGEKIYGEPMLPVTSKNTRDWRHYISYGNRTKEVFKFESSSVKGESLAPPTKMWTLIDRWNMFPVSLQIKGFTLESILRDKFSCVGRRGEGRDIYDIRKIVESGKADIQLGWDMYLQGWNDEDSEWGQRVAPKNLANALMSLYNKTAGTWEDTASEGMLDSSLDFESSFEYVHSLIEDLIASTPKKRLKG